MTVMSGSPSGPAIWSNMTVRVGVPRGTSWSSSWPAEPNNAVPLNAAPINAAPINAVPLNAEHNINVWCETLSSLR